MAYRPRPKKPGAIQVQNPFGVKPSNQSTKAPPKQPQQWRKHRESVDQEPSSWMAMKTTTYTPSSKPNISYSTNKPPKQYRIQPKRKSKKADEPNAMWHSRPKQDPSATVCAICTNPFQNSAVMVEGYKMHRGCFKCGKCRKTLNPTDKSSYEKLNDITLNLRDQFICKGCQVQSKYGTYGKCSVCRKDLPSVYFEDSDGNKYHNDCFTCPKCGISLADCDDRYFSAGPDRWCKKCKQKQLYPGLKPKSPVPK